MRRLPWKSVPCEHCNEETQANCDFCLGSGREIRRVEDLDRVREAIDNFVRACRTALPVLRRFGR